MAKAPSIQWYFRDWLADAQLSQCSPATRGIWMDMLMLMYESQTDRLEGTPEVLARQCRCSPEQALDALDELHFTGAADVYFEGARYVARYARVTEALRARYCEVTARYAVVARRVTRWLESLKSNAHRQKRYRERKRNGRVTPRVTRLSQRSASASASAISDTDVSDTPQPPVRGAPLESDPPQEKFTLAEAPESAPKRKPVVAYRLVMDQWHQAAPDLPRVLSLSLERERKIRARLSKREFAERWQEAARKLNASSFARGDNNTGWVATFDWLFANDTNWLKALEGNYDRRESQQNLARGPGAIRSGGGGAGANGRRERPADAFADSPERKRTPKPDLTTGKWV